MPTADAAPVCDWDKPEGKVVIVSDEAGPGIDVKKVFGLVVAGVLAAMLYYQFYTDPPSK
eukprot:6347087-Prymnesium_polylepis.2